MAGKSHVGSGDDEESLRHEVSALRRKHDETRHSCEDKRQRIRALQQHLEAIQHQEKFAASGLPQTNELDELKDKISEMEQKIEEVDETRLTYLQMIERLKREGAYFTRDLSRVTAAANAKEQDEVELQLMLRDATHVKDEANHSRLEAEASAHNEQRQLKRELLRRERNLAKRREQSVDHEKRMAQRREEIQATRDAAQASIERTIRNPTTVEEELEQIAFYDEQFKQIQHVAGASDVQDIISKFLRQEDTYNMLNLMTKDSQKRINATKQAKLEAHEAVERFRYEGVGIDEAGPSTPTEAADGGDGADGESPVDALLAGERTGTAHSGWNAQHDARLKRTTRTLVDARAGVQHMIDLLAKAPVDLDSFGGTLDTDESTLEGLEYCVRNIQRLLQSTQDAAAVATRDSKTEDTAPTVASRATITATIMSTVPDERVLLLTSKENNVRINEDDLDGDDDDDEDEDDPELPKDNVLSAHDVKEQAERLIMRHTKTKRRKGKLSGGTSAADADVGVTGAHGPSSGTAAQH